MVGPGGESEKENRAEGLHAAAPGKGKGAAHASPKAEGLALAATAGKAQGQGLQEQGAGAGAGAGGPPRAEGGGRRAGVLRGVEERRRLLAKEWDNTTAIYTKTGGLYGFEAWWPTAELNAKLSFLHSAREHLRQEIQDGAPFTQNEISSLDVLCPELSDARIGRLASGKALPVLIQLYINNLEAVGKRDFAYIHTNIQNLKKMSGNALLQMPDVQKLADDKMFLMLSFLRSVLVFFNTTLMRQLSSTFTGAPAGGGKAAEEAAAEAEAAEEEAPLAA